MDREVAVVVLKLCERCAKEIINIAHEVNRDVASKLVAESLLFSRVSREVDKIINK